MAGRTLDVVVENSQKIHYLVKYLYPSITFLIQEKTTQFLKTSILQNNFNR